MYLTFTIKMYLVGLIVLTTICVKNSLLLQCVDHNNNPVDWYILYKFPIIKAHSYKFIRQGVGYAFITAEDTQGWMLGPNSINDSQSIVGLTLNPLYHGNNETWHILYNDQPPNSHSNSKKGHTKGLVLGDDHGGIWLIHSVPKYPPIPEHGYSYPFTGLEFGQSFLCISLNFDNLEKVGIQLQYNEPEIYSQNIPYMFKVTHPQIYLASINTTVETTPGYNVLDINTLNNTMFKTFAKNRYFGEDLYKDLVAPTLKDTLLVETWPNGPGRMPSNCSGGYGAKNIDEINFKYLALNTDFKSTHDHSKWALANTEKWVCIGDINRAVTQTKRGGGTACLQNENVSRNYNSIIDLSENCEGNKV